MDKCCCVNCFNNTYVKDYIKKYNLIGDCPICNSKNIYTIPFKIVGKYLIDCVFKAYEDIDCGTGAMWDGEKHCYYGSRRDYVSVYSVRDILMNEDVFSDASLEKKLLDNIMEDYNPSSREIQKGAEAIDVDDPHLVIKNELYYDLDMPYYGNWNEFKSIISHYNRFFDIDNSTSRQNLLDSLREFFEEFQTVVNIGDTFYRCRCSNAELSNLLYEKNVEKAYKELGPPPYMLTHNQRMSPSGISYLYIADSENTALAEVNAVELDSIIIVKLQLKKQLKILDFTRSFFWGMSIFDKQYDHSVRWINYFFQDFIDEISKPISDKDKEYEYIPTQLLSEYIRFLGYDGICYPSSKGFGGENYVFFCGPDIELDDCNDYPHLINYSDWFTIISFQEVIVTKCEEINKTEYECHLGEEYYTNKDLGKAYAFDIKIINEL